MKLSRWCVADTLIIIDLANNAIDGISCYEKFGEHGHMVNVLMSILQLIRIAVMLVKVYQSPKS